MRIKWFYQNISLQVALQVKSEFLDMADTDFFKF